MSTHSVTLIPSADNPLDVLEKPVSTMFEIIDRYIDWTLTRGFGDYPYSHGELACLSLLAGGIWQRSPTSLVLQEFGSEKSAESLVEPNSKYRGRGDIWFRLGELDYYGEAKVKVPHAGSLTPRKATSFLRILREQTETARNNKTTEAHGLGILFVVPCIMENLILKAPDVLQAYYACWESSICHFTKTTGFCVLWGKYLRDELLSEAAFCPISGTGGRKGTYPGVDILVATMADT
jgi:hypothetical protein